MRNHSLARISILAALGLLLSGCAGGRAGSRQAANADGGNNKVTIHFARNPTPLPPFVARDLEGNVISTASMRGKVTLLSFWATWCPPCRAEIPELAALQKRYGERLQVIGISLDEAPPEEVKQYARKAGINYPLVMATRELVAEYGGVPALPTSFVADTEGRVVQKHVGLYPVEMYNLEIRALLKMPVDAAIETFEDTGQIFLQNATKATELPGVNFSRLTPKQKQAALRRMNSENCTCGCNLTIAQCRVNDTSCSVSLGLARKVVREVAQGVAPRPAAIERK